MSTATKIEPVHLLPSKQHDEFMREADKLSNLLASSKELTSQFDEAIATDKKNKLTTANVHFTLFSSVEGLTPELLAKLPRVGSIEGHTGNLPFDVYEYKDADGKKQSGSFWRGVGERHPIGVRIYGEIDKINNRDKVKNKYTDMSEDVADTTKSDLQAEFTTFLRKLREAVKCYQNIVAANDEEHGLGKVLNVDYAKVYKDDGAEEDDVGKFDYDLSSPKLIVITDITRKPQVAKRFTIENFNRMSVEKAKAAGGKWADFWQSNARGTSDDEDPDESTSKVTTPREFETATAVTLHFVNGAKADAPSWRGLIKYYNEAGSDDRLLTLVYLQDAIATILGVKEIKARVDALTTGTKTPKEGAAELKTAA